jgi:hypothetical protein
MGFLVRLAVEAPGSVNEAHRWCGGASIEAQENTLVWVALVACGTAAFLAFSVWAVARTAEGRQVRLLPYALMAYPAAIFAACVAGSQPPPSPAADPDNTSHRS